MYCVLTKEQFAVHDNQAIVVNLENLNKINKMLIFWALAKKQKGPYSNSIFLYRKKNNISVKLLSLVIVFDSNSILFYIN